MDVNGCINSTQVRLIRKNRPEIFVPNVLNLDSNTGNDKFTIHANEEVDRVLKLQIYDRWGNLVFITENMELNNPSIGWDGVFNGKNVEQGVYVYFIEALLTDGLTTKYFGDLTVIR